MGKTENRTDAERLFELIEIEIINDQCDDCEAVLLVGGDGYFYKGTVICPKCYKFRVKDERNININKNTNLTEK